MDERLHNLEKKVSVLEEIENTSKNAEGASAVQIDMLALLNELRDLRIKMGAIKRKAEKSEEISKEVEALRTENAKQKYRINILVRALNECESRHKTS